MTVWLPIDLNATRPAMPPTIASESEVSASHRSSAISAVNDRLQPQNPEDRSMPYYHWWPKKNTTEWIVYDFKGEQKMCIRDRCRESGCGVCRFGSERSLTGRAELVCIFRFVVCGIWSLAVTGRTIRRLPGVVGVQCGPVPGIGDPLRNRPGGAESPPDRFAYVDLSLIHI